VRFARSFAISVVAMLACTALVGCDAEQAEYAGRVVDDTVTLSAPVLAMPSVNLDAGFAPGSPEAGAAGASRNGGANSAAGGRSAVATAVTLARLGSVVRVKSVAVAAGDRVSVGQEIARLDSAALDANVAIAKAALASARAQVGVLDDAIDTVASNRSTLAASRRKINDSAAQLATTRAQLAAQLADLRALLAKLEAMGAGGGRPPMPPGGVPTGTVQPVAPPGAMPARGVPDPAQIRAGIAKLTAALAKIDAGLAKVTSGRAKLSSASAKLSDARVQLRDLRGLALAGAEGATVGVSAAEYQRSLATLRSPSDGDVVSVVAVGDVLAPGATVAEIRPSGPARVTTWLAPDRLRYVRVGTKAEVSADWFLTGTSGGIDSGGASNGVSRNGILGTAAIPGRVTSIGTRAEYPPTSFATSEIHLTRAIRVEITTSPTAEQPSLPPGTPVDVRFLGK